MPVPPGLSEDDLHRPLLGLSGAEDEGDPYVLTTAPGEAGHRYHLFHTEDRPSDGRAIPVYGSDDLRTFTPLGRALVALPGAHHWAPCVVRTPAGFVMLYSRSTPGQPYPDAGHRLRRALADRPEGPYRDAGEIPLDAGDFTIDADVYRRDGRLLLAYARELWPEGCAGVGLAEVEMEPDLSAPAGPERLLAVPRHPSQLYEAGRSMPWRRVEGIDWDAGDRVDWYCMEAPVGLVSPAGRAVWLYSFGNWRDDTYGIGALREEGDGTVTDLASEGHVVLGSGSVPGIGSVGHPSLVRPGLLVCHGRFTPGGPRRAFLAPLAWDAEDRPHCPPPEGR